MNAQMVFTIVRITPSAKTQMVLMSASATMDTWEMDVSAPVR